MLVAIQYLLINLLHSLELYLPICKPASRFISNQSLSCLINLYFRLNMWIAVLLVLLITGTIFYAMARYYMNLQNYKHDHDVTPGKRKNVKIEANDEGLFLCCFFIHDQFISLILF